MLYTEKQWKTHNGNRINVKLVNNEKDYKMYIKTKQYNA